MLRKCCEIGRRHVSAMSGFVTNPQGWYVASAGKPPANQLRILQETEADPEGVWVGFVFPLLQG